MFAYFTPLFIGQLGKGPRAPSLLALQDGVATKDELERMMAIQFHFCPAFPEELQHGGKLYAVSKGAFAAVLMYYEECEREGECPQVGARLRESLAQVKGHSLSVQGYVDNTHAVLCQWGKKVRRHFDIQNLHLTTKKGDLDVDRVVSAVQDIQTTFSELRDQNILILGKVGQLRLDVARLEQRISTFSAVAPATAAASLPVASTAAAVSAALAPVTGVAVPAMARAMAGAVFTTAAAPKLMPQSGTQATAYASPTKVLPYFAQASIGANSMAALGEKNAKELFVQSMQMNGAVPPMRDGKGGRSKQDSSVAELSVKFFKASVPLIALTITQPFRACYWPAVLAISLASMWFRVCGFKN